MNNVPQSFQSVLWSKDITTLHVDHDAAYIIHQVLSHGTLEHIRWLFSTYSKEKIEKIFFTQPYKDYPASRFSFITKFFLTLSSQLLDPKLYVTNIPRAIKRR